MTLNHYQYNERPESQEPAIELLEKLGWKYLSPSDAEKQRGNLYNVILKDDLMNFLKEQRYEYKGEKFQFSSSNIARAISDIDVPLQSGLMKTSKEIYDLLIYGKSYEEDLYDGGKSSFDLKFIDWEHPEKNILRVTEEFSVQKLDRSKRRPDIVLTVNGIPLVVIECKKSSVSIDEGIRQNIKNWKADEIPHLFKFIQLVVAMNSHSFKYGTCGTKFEFFVPWKEKDTDWMNKQLEELIQGRLPKEQDKNIIAMLSPERLFEIIQYYTLYDNNVKKVARYQQFFGIRKAINRITLKDGKGTRNGVIWHTQGSGKSLTMVMLVKKIIAVSQEENSDIKNPRFVLVNDRINLDKQLRDNFSNTQMSPARAKTGKGLIELLKDEGETLITTVIHKFEKAAKQKTKLNDNNIFILIDECHRTQSGNFHNFMTDVLPNAVKIGFTGTPLLKTEKQSTYDRIGPLIDSYPINKAEEDKVIVPLVYEGRKIPQKTTSDAIDQYLEQSLIGLTEQQQEDLKRKYSRFTSIAPTMPRLTCLAYAIKQHYERYIKPNGFKAMIAESSRVSAIELHKLLKSLGLKTAVVISPEARAEGEELNNSDKDKIAQFFKTEIEPLYGMNYEAYEDWAKNSFTDGEDIDILIVKDKLLTGFDAPIAQVLYVDKSMKTHNLLQAIARVNRVFPGKKNGRIVDFYGIFENLTSAMDLYSDKESGMNQFDKDDIKKTIYGPEDVKKELYNNYNQVMQFIAGHNTDDTEEIQLLFKDEDIRKDFYEKLLDFSNSLDTAVSNYNVYEGIGIDEIKRLQKDYVYLQKLRSGIKLRYGETVDFSVYESSIKNLLNQFVSAEADEIVINPLYLSDKATMEKELEKLPSSRAKAEAMVYNIATRLSETREKDPIFYKTFRQRLDETIAEYNKTRNEEAYLAQMKDLENDYEKGFVGNKYPTVISDDDDAKGFYGNIKLELEKNIKISENDDIDNQLGILAILIKNTFRNSQKPGWQYNTVLINNIKQEIEDAIFDFVDNNGITLDMDQLDKIEEDILMTAKSIF